MKENIDTLALILLDSLAFLSYNQKREILKNANNISDILDKEFLLSLPNIDKIDRVIEFLTKENLQKVEQEISNYTVITYLDENYPDAFWQLEDYPLCLYCLGDISLLQSQDSLSVVGSRKTLPQVLKFVSLLVKQVSQNRVIICGNTEGVEQEILSSTMGQNTICFLGGGIEKSFSNKELFTIAQNGLIITEYYPTHLQKGYQFIDRNRLIAVLCQEMLLISGSEKSGVRYTVEFAKQNYKTLYALPYTIGEPSGELCNEEIKNGAILVNKLQDLVKVENSRPSLTEQEKLVLSLIEQGTTQEDFIIEQSNLAVQEVLQILVTLEIKDYIIKSGATTYALTKF